MCGIVGYIGFREPKDVLVEGLKTLEYRGYDSAGIALKNDTSVQVIKEVGRISSLEEKINKEKLIYSHIGIAHTRWATHGGVTEVNAHPHTVGRVTLVHNGIIENAMELKEKLSSEGVTFNTETDTEVLTALIDYYYDNDPIMAIERAINDVRGSYALAIIFKDQDKLFAVRKDLPLIVGYGDKEYFVASDISAIINYTNRYSLLDENEIVTLDFNGISVVKDDKEIKKEVLVTELTAESKEKCGYEHYMLKEIMEEPVVLEKTLKPFIDNFDNIFDVSGYEEIHIVACGSAMYAGMIGKSLLEENSNIRVLCEVASEYRYKKILYDRKTLVIVISQSGETADTIAAMRKAKENGALTLAIVNVKGSTIARESDRQIFIEAGPEIAVATTKAYILQVAVMALLACRVAGKKDIVDELKRLPRLLKEVIDRRDIYLEIAKKISNREDIFFIGRKIDYAISLEGSLKLKEVSYIHSEAYQAGELKHGTISLIDKGTPVFAIVTEDDIREKTISNICEVKARGAMIIVVSNEDGFECDYLIKVPRVSEFLQPILVVPCLQLIAYEVAKIRGCDIDKPKNLAKSVTVE
ncbi:glucosamine--fructose-6-phosphate aminotransferase [isomerizing] [Mycoplasma sp. CAG:877]|nr:glucosamine--fructose-6-phosphate aminotransferase [isomerizing] [Mycoplasma sp. CAG:877]